VAATESDSQIKLGGTMVNRIALRTRVKTDGIEMFGSDQDPNFDWEKWIAGILADPNLSNDAKRYALALLTSIAESLGIDTKAIAAEAETAQS
jgi:hypothetical protein